MQSMERLLDLSAPTMEKSDDFIPENVINLCSKITQMSYPVSLNGVDIHQYFSESFSTIA